MGTLAIANADEYGYCKSVFLTCRPWKDNVKVSSFIRDIISFITSNCEYCNIGKLSTFGNQKSSLAACKRHNSPVKKEKMQKKAASFVLFKFYYLYTVID
jgi:hypothetical protein